jgi:putative endonuclease
MTDENKKKAAAGNWIIYVLQCSDGTLYTGISNNVDRRLKEHNAGTASKYTRGRRPVKLLASWRVADKSTALRTEHRVKALSREEKLRAIKVKSISRFLKTNMKPKAAGR